MNEKKFSKIIKNFIKAIVAGDQDEFMMKLLQDPTSKVKKINSDQMEELLFYRHFSKTHLSIYKDLFNNNSEMAAMALGLMKEGWMGRAEAQFKLMQNPAYSQRYNNLAQQAATKTKH